jgi:hypothetical protein
MFDYRYFQIEGHEYWATVEGVNPWNEKEVKAALVAFSKGKATLPVKEQGPVYDAFKEATQKLNIKVRWGHPLYYFDVPNNRVERLS